MVLKSPGWEHTVNHASRLRLKLTGHRSSSSTCGRHGNKETWLYVRIKLKLNLKTLYKINVLKAQEVEVHRMMYTCVHHFNVSAGKGGAISGINKV